MDKMFVVPIPEGAARDVNEARLAKVKASLALHDAETAYYDAFFAFFQKLAPPEVRLKNENPMYEAFPERYEGRISEDEKFIVFYIDKRKALMMA